MFAVNCASMTSLLKIQYQINPITPKAVYNYGLRLRTPFQSHIFAFLDLSHFFRHRNDALYNHVLWYSSSDTIFWVEIAETYFHELRREPPPPSSGGGTSPRPNWSRCALLYFSNYLRCILSCGNTLGLLLKSAIAKTMDELLDAKIRGGLGWFEKLSAKVCLDTKRYEHDCPDSEWLKFMTPCFAGCGKGTFRAVVRA